MRQTAAKITACTKLELLILGKCSNFFNQQLYTTRIFTAVNSRYATRIPKLQESEF